MDPLFSVIIPTYNRDSLIVETIESVLNQSYKNFEIIVIDDCSTDNTRQVLDKYIVEGTIIYRLNKENRERAYSRNKGLEVAKGDYATFLDSDDILFSNCLQNAYEYIVGNPSAKMFHCIYEKINITDNKKLYIHFPSIDNPFKALTEGNFLSNIGVFLHKDIFTSIKLDEEPILTFSEDYDYYMRTLIKAGSLGRIDTVCGVLREHNLRSTNTIQAIKKIESIQYLLNKNINNPEFVAAYGPYIPDFIAYLYLYLGAQYSIGGGDGFTSLKYILKAIAKTPKLILKAKTYHHLAVVLKYQYKKYIN